MMRDANRIDSVLDELRRVWKENPDQRLGQLIYNAAVRSPKPNVDLYYLEEDDMVEGIKRLGVDLSFYPKQPSDNQVQSEW